MQTKSIRHTFTRAGRFYYSRRIPNDLADHYTVPRIGFALSTSSHDEAKKLASKSTHQLDAYWANIRAMRLVCPGHDKRTVRATASVVEPDRRLVLSSHGIPASPLSPTMTEARDIYLRAKGTGRPVTFSAAAHRSTAYLIAACGDKRLTDYNRADALAFRDLLLARSLSGSSVTRNFGYVKAIINFVAAELAIEMRSPFSGVYYDREAGVADRQPIPLPSIRKVQQACMELDDDRRLLIALLSDTGMRLAEAAGLLRADFVDLTGNLPYVLVRKHPWRPLKTKSSERMVPLCSASLWAARRIMSDRSASKFAFPRYNQGSQTAANTASATLNKWMAKFVPAGCTLHGFRHSMRDRLRAVECPADVIDQIGGWTTSGVGHSYGKGHPLSVLYAWMDRAVAVSTRFG